MSSLWQEKMRFPTAILLALAIAVVSGGIARIVYPSHEKYPDRLEPVLHLIARANIERGRRLARICETCHSFEKGGVSLPDGPNLWDVVGAPKAGAKGFEYSENLREAGGNWTYDELNEYIWNPKHLIPDGDMAYIGLRRAQDRADLIGWMRTMSDDPVPLPEE